ncbi:MAG TPA: allantoicase [Nocardioidaceae bacterium]|nr:allantoicase [Nocardioidaceae bacterium]
MNGFDFRSMPDLALRSFGGSVVYANDELFAARENLIRPGPADFDPERFGHKGKIYDGWETRRRRKPGHDIAIVRLGASGIVRGIVIDTSWFKGNYPPEASIEATCVDGYPTPEELLESAVWETILPQSPLKGDAQNAFVIENERCWTHVRLSIYPDGGVARLRVHGEAVPDPKFLDPVALDLAALENGAHVVGCSNLFYSSPNNLLAPDRPRSMADGWETARRRDDGNDWVAVQLAAAGIVRMIELDTTYFIGNAPGRARLSACDATSSDIEDPETWFELLPRARLQPDTRHRFVLAEPQVATHVRLDIFPDGGMARLRLYGTLTSAGREAMQRRWRESTPHWG